MLHKNEKLMRHDLTPPPSQSGRRRPHSWSRRMPFRSRAGMDTSRWTEKDPPCSRALCLCWAGGNTLPLPPPPQTKRSILCALLFCVCLSVCLRVRARVCAHACVCMSEHTQMCMNTSKLTYTHTGKHSTPQQTYTKAWLFNDSPGGQLRNNWAGRKNDAG